MAIDIRASCTCSLGTLVRASISDDYVQGTGLIKTKGSCELSGIYTPAVGTVVTFSYTKAGVTRNIPRKLRVLSSFADPFRRTTTVELGCLLTYLQDKSEKVEWNAFNDPANSGLTEDDAKIITVPIYASSIASECLTQLGIGGFAPLTNRFSIAKFDFSPGYVNILSDLLVSENRCGYLNFSEHLVIFSLGAFGGTGPVIDQSKIIDIGSIGVGQLPGDAVTVSYSTLKLKKPDSCLNDNNNPNESNTTLWEREETTGLPQTIYVQNPFYAYNPFPYPVPQFFQYTHTPKTVTQTEYDELNRVKQRVTTDYTILAEIAPSYVQHIAGASGGAVSPSVGSQEMTTVTTETFTYVVKQKLTTTGGQTTTTDDVSYEQVKQQQTEVSEPLLKLYASTQIYDYAGQDNVAFTLDSSNQSRFIASRTIVTPETKTQSATAVVTKAITEQYKCFCYTQRGQQSIAAALEGNRSANNFYSSLAPTYLMQGTALVYEGAETRITSGRAVGLQRRPDQAELNNAKNADGGDPNNGFQTSSSSELELAVGSHIGQRRIELSMPYAPDDTFIKLSDNPVCYTSVPSDAKQKAAAYGRTQNRLLLGNRYGMNIQTLPELLPSAPYAPFYVKAAGLTALYCTNGTNWQLSTDGCLVSTDALFMGGVGGTGTPWFPVAPGITTLPSTPPVVDGNMTVTTPVPVWNETMKVEGQLRTSIEVKSLPYSLEDLTIVDSLSLRLGLTVPVFLVPIIEYSDFSSTDGLSLVSTYGVVSNKLYLTDATSNDVGNVWTSATTNYNRDFTVNWVMEVGGGSGADGFCLQWYTANNVNGGQGGDAGRVSSSNVANAFGFNTFGSSTVKWFKNNSEQSSQSCTLAGGSWRTTVYYWLDYSHTLSQAKLYYSTTNSKPLVPQHTFVSISFGTTPYYIGFGAGTGGANDNHILQSFTVFA